MTVTVFTVVKTLILSQNRRFLSLASYKRPALGSLFSRSSGGVFLRQCRTQGSPYFLPSRTFFNKPIPQDAVFPVLFGSGIIGVTLGLNFLINRRENRYSDPSNQPVYENTPPSSRKQVRSGLNDAQATDSKKLQPKIQLPKKVQHVIIGAGAAGMAAARAIRASDPRSCVLLIAGDESCGELGLAETNQQAPPPYVRPLLSKGLWWRTPERRAQMLNPEGDIRKHSWLYFEPLSFFIDPEKLSETEEGGVCFLRGNPVVALHPDRHTVCLADGQEIAYSCCLIATGAQPRRMPELEHCSISGADLIKARRITYFRNLSDYSLPVRAVV
uniref:Pyr_redox_2 domain-containing protein n=1 Tax=Mesocestoides corti TaxID=53468 RepID=A0A5K3FAJ5_MESCO